MAANRALPTDAHQALGAALALRATLHEPGQREKHRALLAAAIEHAVRAATPEALLTLAQAHAARADDALHGAGQLSLGAQRAPTSDACEDGWRRVETIVEGAEASARAAQAAAHDLETAAPDSSDARAARRAAHAAAACARAARRLVEERNHAFTFHTDGGFSFGEGWYLAAAAVLAGVPVQIEPGGSRAEEAARFLRAAGVGPQLVPYRSRPRANKQTTDVVARAFRADPLGAQRRLRAAFLGDAPVPPTVAEFVDARLARAPRRKKKVLVWLREGSHHPGRNSTTAELTELSARARRADLVPVWIGDAMADVRVPPGAVDMILFWKDPIFRHADGRRAQLAFFEHLRSAHGLVGQVGVTTAGMDGPALLGLPTLYLTEQSNVRMRAWVGAVPGYRELVREAGYLETVSEAFAAWRASSK